MKSASRVALYARVSTVGGQNPEMQLRELREYCERRSLKIVEEYVDKGISGSRERRPGRAADEAERLATFLDCNLSLAWK